MAEPVPKTQTSESSLIAWQLMHLSFQLGFLKATANRTMAICEQMLTILASRPPTAEPPPSRLAGLVRTMGEIRELWEHFERLHRIVSVVRAVVPLARWLMLGWSVHGALRSLGII